MFSFCFCCLLSSNFCIISDAFQLVNNFLFIFFVLFSLLFSQQLLYDTIVLPICQYLFRSFFKLFWACLFNNPKRRKRDLNPRAALTTYTLSRGASSASWVFLLNLLYEVLRRISHSAFIIIFTNPPFVNIFFYFFIFSHLFQYFVVR